MLFDCQYTVSCIHQTSKQRQQLRLCTQATCLAGKCRQLANVWSRLPARLCRRLVLRSLTLCGCQANPSVSRPMTRVKSLVSFSWSICERAGLLQKEEGQSVEKLDLREQFKHLYLPSSRKVEVVNVPEFRFAMVDGVIEPGSTPGTLTSPSLTTGTGPR